LKPKARITFLVLITFTFVILLFLKNETTSPINELAFSQEKTSIPDSLILNGVAEIMKTDMNNLKILKKSIVTFQFINEAYQSVKIFNELTSETREFFFDSSGNPIEYKEIYAKEQKKKFQKMGNMHPMLFEAIEKNQLHDEVEVIIKIKVSGLPIDKTENGKEESKEYQDQLNKALEDFKHMVKKEKFKGVFNYSYSSPFVTAVLTIEEIKKLSKNDLVVFLGLHREPVILDENPIKEN
jgi:hypothetical protein